VTAIYPGSFDPVTLGHIDIIRRAAKLADRLTVAVLDNPRKKPLFSVAERVAFLHDALDGVEGVEITAFSGLLAEFARQRGVTAIIRGLRDAEDYTNETRYARNNRLFKGNIETLFIPASPELSHISSRIAREAAAFILPAGLDDAALRQLVPNAVRAALREKFTKKG
jgi:pantetheine-phosphate adenylyltransferase